MPFTLDRLLNLIKHGLMSPGVIFLPKDEGILVVSVSHGNY